jgi:hypothetical protein
MHGVEGTAACGVSGSPLCRATPEVPVLAVTLYDLIRSWLIDLRSRNLFPKTISTYGGAARRLEAGLPERSAGQGAQTVWSSRYGILNAMLDGIRFPSHTALHAKLAAKRGSHGSGRRCDGRSLK